MRTHRYAVDQHVRYAEAHPPNDVWGGRYEIVFLLPAGDRESQYQIRGDDQTYDQVVWETQLQGLGRKKTRLSKRPPQAMMACASPARHNRNELERQWQSQDLRRWDDEGGAPRSGRRFSEAPQLQTASKLALYYFNVRTDGGLIEDPEGNVYADLHSAREEALTIAREMIATGDQAEDRKDWRIEIMDRANKPVLVVTFPEALDPGTKV